MRAQTFFFFFETSICMFGEMKVKSIKDSDCQKKTKENDKNAGGCKNKLKKYANGDEKDWTNKCEDTILANNLLEPYIDYPTRRLLRVAIFAHWAVKSVLSMRSSSLPSIIKRRASVHSPLFLHFARPGDKRRQGYNNSRACFF